MRDLTLYDRRLPFALGVIVAATILALLSTAQAAVWLGHDGQAVPWTGLLKARLVDWYCYAAFCPLISALVRRFPIDGRRWAESLPVLLLASLVMAVGKEALYVEIGNWFRPGIFVLSEILAEDYLSEVFTVWALIAVTHAILFHRGLRAEAQPRAEAPAAADRFVVRDGVAVRFVPAAEVDWIDAQGNYARLNTARGRYLVRETMAALEQRLGAHFLRVHRGAIVNLDRIARIERRPHAMPIVVLECGARIASGRAFAAAVRSLLR